MYRPRAYAIDDIPVLQETMRRRGFATIAAVIEGRVEFAYAPMIVDVEPQPFGTLRFHLARGNPLAELDGGELRLSFLGPDAYVSPDWYEGDGFVPTWNYIAVEASGRARLLDDGELRRLLADLSAHHEERLRPKPPWTIDKLDERRMTALTAAIRGFAMRLDALEGKFKLSQDKTAANIAAVMAGLEARGDSASLAVARAMKENWTTNVRAEPVEARTTGNPSPPAATPP